MNAERLAAIRALLDAATPGPWMQDDDLVRWEGNNFVGDDGRKGSGRQGVCMMNSATGNATNDAAFIAAAPTIIAELLAELEMSSSPMMRDPIMGRITNAQSRALGTATPELQTFIAELIAENERLQVALANAAMAATDRGRAG